MDTSVKTAKFDEVWYSYPREGHRDFFKSLGGNLSSMDAEMENDDSTTRLSYAFNKSGHVLTQSSIYRGGNQNIKDKDGFNYIIDAHEMKTFLTKKFGKPHHLLSKSDCVGRCGILMFENVKSLHGKTHYDLFNGQETADVKGDYWEESSFIGIWELK